jgi:hypothetical protein
MLTNYWKISSLPGPLPTSARSSSVIGHASAGNLRIAMADKIIFQECSSQIRPKQACKARMRLPEQATQERADASLRQNHGGGANGSWRLKVPQPHDFARTRDGHEIPAAGRMRIRQLRQSMYPLPRLIGTFNVFCNSSLYNRPPSRPGNHQTKGQLI